MAKGVDKVTEDRDPDGFAVFFIAEEITPIKQPAESYAQGGFDKDQMLKTNTFVQRLDRMVAFLVGRGLCHVVFTWHGRLKVMRS